MGNLAARLADLWRGLFDALVRDNKILPPVLALLALLLFAWVVAGAFVSDPDEEGSSSGTAELVQSRDPAAGADPPEVEDRDADSYAAYRNKDPFRQLLAPASETTTEDTSEDTSGSAPDGDTTTPSASVPPEDTGGGGQGGGTDDTGNGNGGNGNGGGNGGGEASRKDTDGDGITNRREEALGLDPRDPDSDGDGIDDGKDDADGDGVPDGRQGGGAGGGGGGGGAGNGGGGGGGGGGGAGDDELFDSGGYVP